MKSFITILALGLLTSTFAHAELPVNETLKEVVSEKFYRDANNPQIGLGQIIGQLLGRKLIRADYEVLTLSSQSMRNPWAFAYASDDKKSCTASDNSSEFLIVLRVKVKNTAANKYMSYTFKISAEQSLTAVNNAGSEIDNCADISDGSSLYTIAEAKNLVSDYEYVEIAPPPAKATQSN